MTEPSDPAATALESQTAPSARRQETRTRLLEAAAEVFVEEGFQAASVEAVCSRAGFSRGAFYSNFSSKEELFLTALAREYEHRVTHLEGRGAELTELLQRCSTKLTRGEAARHISEYFAPSGTEASWFALETEFLMLAMRDPSIAPGYTDFLAGFNAGLAGLVESIVSAAGRRFTLPVERALPVLGGVFERALRISAIAGNDAPEGLDELSDRLAELLFAITEETPHQAEGEI